MIQRNHIEILSGALRAADRPAVFVLSARHTEAQSIGSPCPPARLPAHAVCLYLCTRGTMEDNFIRPLGICCLNVYVFWVRLGARLNTGEDGKLGNTRRRDKA